MTGRLPNGDGALVEEKKLSEYLLNLQHADGASKARFFLARGFTAAAWPTMRDALIAQGRNNRVTKMVQTTWGTRYQVDCHCPTPDGSNPCIRSVWEIANEGPCPRLLTAYPLAN